MGWAYIIIPERKENHSSCDFHGNGNTDEKKEVNHKVRGRQALWLRQNTDVDSESCQDNSHTGIEIVLQTMLASTKSVVLEQWRGHLPNQQQILVQDQPSEPLLRGISFLIYIIPEVVCSTKVWESTRDRSPRRHFAHSA